MSTKPAPDALQPALQLAALGETISAFNAFVGVMESGSPPPETAPAFGWFLARQMTAADHPTVHRAYELALTRCWVRPEALVPAVLRQLAARYPKALSVEAQAGEPQLLGLLADPLLLALLGATAAATPALETLLARFRHGVLKRVAAGQEVAAALPTLAALAVRGALSGYALTLPASARHAPDLADEAELLAIVRERVAAGGEDYAAAMAVLACYEAPAPALLVPGQPMADLIDRHVAAPRARQASIAGEIAALTPIDDSNRAVAAQYEVHPYPAWTGEPEDPVALPDAVTAALGGAERIEQVLVAGCGTGQQAFAAARTWPNADLLAVDVSRASLAYAIDKARQTGETRITFAQADLLRLGDLGRRFQVVEAMGVLHHLADPDAGLAALRDLLAPGGVLGLGLYSGRARAGLAELRASYGKAATTDAEIRAFRAWALATARDHPFLRAAEFYSIGGCRDAIFHVRERDYALAEIGALLDRAGLRLLALQPPPPAYERLADALPDPTDLAGWQAAELADPDLFASMIELWVQAA